MASSSLNPQMNADKRIQTSFSFKHDRPKMLKDFLKDDSFSCSSNDFRSNVTDHKPSPILIRSGSKAAATTFYALNKVIKAVKFFPFASVKSPLVLPRSISRKLSRRTRNRNETFPQDSVKVKDILRWRSFRDLAEEKTTPLDFSSSSSFPIQCSTTTAAATTGSTSTSTTTSCSKRSSWCDSDFTAADSPSWGGENDESWGSKTGRNPEGELSFEEAEQHSPVSVLVSPFCDEESIFPFHPSFSKRKCMFMQRYQEFMSLIELENLGESYVDNLLFDFFKNELAKNAKFGELDDCENLQNTAKSWINGEYEEVKDMKEVSVKDMERGVDWKEFKEEQQEMAMELEIQFLSDLFDELLNDFKFC
ncbi:hypothetical protein Adt_21163 [Abeliophyllum distichum]|uniref:DUF4378 domain-containing protein n=1 Tax=Abeliophyllum distichum TaxID=126358 RepID=A0ABD1SYK8_9LAMI